MDFNIQNKTLEIVNRIGHSPDKLIEVLIETQATSDERYISEEQLVTIAQALEVPLSKAYGVATFYSMLSTEKRGKYVVQVCNSGPCYIKGAGKISEVFQSILGIKVGQVTEDGMFSLEYTSCIGACDVAPAVRINDKVYGNLDREKAYKIVDTLRRGEEING